jgi:hypothetical protein
MIRLFPSFICTYMRFFMKKFGGSFFLKVRTLLLKILLRLLRGRCLYKMETGEMVGRAQLIIALVRNMFEFGSFYFSFHVQYKYNMGRMVTIENHLEISHKFVSTDKPAEVALTFSSGDDQSRRWCACWHIRAFVC